MNYDTWKSTDCDPEGSPADHQCPGCSARDGERCSIDCTCGFCEGESDGTDATAEERAAEARDQMDAIFLGLK